MKTPETLLSQEKSTLETEFDFETVTVNKNGEIIERNTGCVKQFSEDLGNGVILEMIAVSGGIFWMGSLQKDGFEDEHPRHQVRVNSFWMSKYPITQEQWDAIIKWTPPYRCQGNSKPVDRVSWFDATEFCKVLSKKAKRGYRLPSEAEWEYACRAGTNTAFFFGETITTDLANYVGEHTYLSEPKGIYRHQTTEVGSFPPNGFGIYDMHGNVWEWCADVWHDNYDGAPGDGSVWDRGDVSQRVVRGGCWHDTPDVCRSASRLKFKAGEREDFTGFRVALSSLETQSTSSLFRTGFHPFQTIKQCLERKL